MYMKCLTKISNLDIEILKYTNIYDISNVTRVCKYFCHLLSFDDFWRRKFQYDYKFNDYDPNITFKSNYKRLILLDLLIKHFWLNTTGVSTKREPNKNLIIPLCVKPRHTYDMDNYHVSLVDTGRCRGKCISGQVKPNLWNWLLDQLNDSSEVDLTADDTCLLKYCLIPLRKGDAVEIYGRLWSKYVL